jgi:beta-lactamase regulating signal transducer with metallopeptidase domain/Mg-chelatase subunit ChlD
MSIDLAPRLADAAVRALALGVATFVGLLLFRVRSPAARHATWTLMLAGMLLQIPLGLLAPTVTLKTLPTLPAGIRPMVPPRVPGSTLIRKAITSSPRLAIKTRTEHTSGTGRSNGTLATYVYLVISILLFVRMAVGSRGLRRVLRSARPISDLGSEIYESALLVAPGSVGWLRPKILLPQDWRNWDCEKLRAVLVHERAHIRRRDWLIRFTSHVNVCVFWFHPLAWWTERELARLAEEACDDVALSEINDRDEYAAALVDVARAAAAGGGVLNWRIISMARGSNVVRRVNRILDLRIQVPKPFGHLAWATLLACGLPVIYLSAAVVLTPTNQDVTLLRHTAVLTSPARPASEPLLLKKQSPMRMIAQGNTNQLRETVPPLVPSRSGDLTLTMCILIDNSGSMRNKREAVKAAALALVKSSKPGDRVCVVNFNDEVYYDLPHGEDFTGNIEEMQDALTHIDSRGGSAMRDAVRASIGHLQQAARDERKVLVVVADGNDNSSTISQEHLVNEVRDSGVRVYAIGLAGDDDPHQAAAARLALRQLAEVSGGRDYYPKDLAEVESISPEVANELRKR